VKARDLMLKLSRFDSDDDVFVQGEGGEPLAATGLRWFNLPGVACNDEHEHGEPCRDKAHSRCGVIVERKLP
jgi:hypothetical protein